MISALVASAENNTTTAFYSGFNHTADPVGAGGGPVFPSYIRTTYMIFCIVILSIGVVGNVMVPIVILKSKDMRNSTNIFLMNLSVADLMVLLVCTPTVLVEVNSPPEVWVLGKEMCKAVPFVELTVAHASVLTILAISFERYYAICEPLKAGYVCTKARAFLICVLAWLFAALFTSPILFIAEYRFSEYYDTTMVPVCLMQANSIWPAVYFITTIAVFFLLPLCVLMALYTVIARHLMAEPGPPGCKSAGTPGGTLSSTSGQQQGGESSNLRARRQVVLMLGTVVVSFFICLMPFRVLTLWIIVVPSETVFRLGVEGYYNLLYFCRVMFYLNSAINPILYNLMSSKFRLGFSRLCGLRRRRRGRWRRGSELNRLQGSAADLTTVQRGDLAGSRMSGTVFTRNGTLTSLSYSSFYHNNRHNSTRLSHCDTRENNNSSPKNGTRKSLIVRNPSTSLEPGTTSAGSAAVLARFTVRQGSFDAQPESYV